MPSGAKKRKAARRKKEMGIHPPDSPTNPSPGNGESHDSKGDTSDEGDERKGESPRSESVAVAAMDSSENGKEKPGEEIAKVTENPTKEEKEKEKEKVVEEETMAIPVSREAEDVSVELVQSEKEEAGLGGGGSTEVAEEKSAAVASVVPVHEPVFVTEEVIEATETAAVTSEALAQESEAKSVPIFDTPLAPVVEQSQPRESGELCHESERSEAAPAPLVEHRATWWNCCGLFDVFTSSRDASRN
ncbi:uncharacterized protein [Elaeis guineensis]|uniref:Uncharacterized protein LOC105041023 isoform X1 n=1 Tax=Elaeis guineensis var. tenera TaxID=51953 RepID=A0A6I9R0R9_ELAGV|nr:uncharacterized protein LOC105041023 isoform X1 [Elaeis guineensis]